ncbi:Copia protein [Gossypium australe]|uniref:Copia protein n=1 Tax=Gossypium australe TaxID=47621 RepID=A0A5B6V1T7_9ROSI|nr:Copia protein [Gossypium australe]
MQEKMFQLERNKVWELVPQPKDHSILKTKWICINKIDELRNIIRNKASMSLGYQTLPNRCQKILLEWISI